MFLLILHHCSGGEIVFRNDIELRSKGQDEMYKLYIEI